MKKLIINKDDTLFLVVNQTPIIFTTSQLINLALPHRVFTFRDFTHKQQE